MSRRDVGWLLVALGTLAIGGLLAWWVRTPSLGVKAQLYLDKQMEQLARAAGADAGRYPPRVNLGNDPWGRPYRYERVQPAGPVRLWSLGADGVDQQGGGDDIASWTR